MAFGKTKPVHRTGSSSLPFFLGFFFSVEEVRMPIPNQKKNVLRTPKKRSPTRTVVPKNCDFGAPASKNKGNRGAPQIGSNPYEEPMAYFLAPNWNSDKSYLVVGPRSLLSTVIGDRRKFDKETLFLAKAITAVGAVTVGLCVMLAATTDLPGILGFIALVTISIIGSHPRFAKDIEPLTCNLTFVRRRSAYTLAYIMHGSPEQRGWWNGAFPSTDRQVAWERPCMD